MRASVDRKCVVSVGALRNLALGSGGVFRWRCGAGRGWGRSGCETCEGGEGGRSRRGWGRRKKEARGRAKEIEQEVAVRIGYLALRRGEGLATWWPVGGRLWKKEWKKWTVCERVVGASDALL